MEKKQVCVCVCVCVRVAICLPSNASAGLRIYKEIRHAQSYPPDLLLKVPDHLATLPAANPSVQATIPAANPSAQDAVGHPQPQQGAPRWCPDASKRAPDASKRAPNAPKRSQASKREPKRFQIHTKIDPKMGLARKALQSKKVLFSLYIFNDF